LYSTLSTINCDQFFVNKCKQVAQLSQRDSAAGWVSYGQKWETANGDNILRTL